MLTEYNRLMQLIVLASRLSEMMSLLSHLSTNRLETQVATQFINFKEGHIKISSCIAYSRNFPAQFSILIGLEQNTFLGIAMAIMKSLFFVLQCNICSIMYTMYMLPLNTTVSRD